MRYILGLVIVVSVFLQACAHRTTKANRQKASKQVEIVKKANHKLEDVEIVGKGASVEDKNTENKNSAAISVASVTADTDEEIATGWIMAESDRLYFELSGEKFENLSSQQIYDLASEKYRSNDLKALEAYTNLLVSKYPRSRFADNALYLQGMLAFSIKSYAKSLESFQKIIQQYPNSNKVVSALFAKGILYKKMNLNSESESVLSSVKSKFPGSPESLRADAEIKILKQ